MKGLGRTESRVRHIFKPRKQVPEETNLSFNLDFQSLDWD